MKNDDTISGRKTLQEIDLEGRSKTARQTLSGVVTEGGEGPIMLAGRYKVVKRLGEGGMGSVWLAEDTKLDGRLVAVKMLPAVLAGKKGAYRQVKQEALVAMKLSHPNIATVRAFEEDEGEAPFLVMDYIEGEGLDEILSEQRSLREEEVLKLLGPVAAALDYAHAKGVVHRDVKPGNVIVDRNGTPFLLDFGIAREIQETMTRVTGKFSSGTLLYMSPEQLRGRAPKAAQDVYSFAAMAYECLAGHPPFSRGQIEWQIVNETPEELPGNVVSESLRKSIMAGLAKEPEGRPVTCSGVLGLAASGETSRPGEAEIWGKARIGAGKTAEDQRETMDATWQKFEDVSVEQIEEWRRSVDCEPLERVEEQVVEETEPPQEKEQTRQPVRHPGSIIWYVVLTLMLVRLVRAFILAGPEGIGFSFQDSTGRLFWGGAAVLWVLILVLLFKKKKK